MARAITFPLSRGLSFAPGNALASAPGWVQPGAIIDEIFTTGQYYPRPIASELADVRASVAYASDASGVWSSFLSNVTRITNAGMTNEPARTNSIRNNSMQGAVAGTPGTLPTNWSIAFTNGGSLVANVAGIGTESGIDYIDLAFTGTSGTGASVSLRPETLTAIIAATGQTWTDSTFLKAAAGTCPAVFLYLDEGTNAGGFVLGHQLINLVPTAAALASQRLSGTILLSGGATVAAVQPQMVLFFANTTAYSFTLRIGWPQIELGASVTSPIRTTTAAVTRAADAITIQRTGIGRVVFTFDDNSQQTVSGISTAAQYTIPTNLNRAIIKRITGYAA